MRRVLREELPAFSHLFGVHPWDVDRLSYDEIATYRSQLAELVAKTEEVRNGSR